MKTPRQEPPSQKERKERLAAALKANIAKRKAQARSRSEDAPPQDSADNEQED